MSAPSTETPGRTDRRRDAERQPTSRGRRGLSTLGRPGSTAIVAGGALLARAVGRLRTNRRRAAAQALIGVGLVAVGLRQRRSSSGRPGHSPEMSPGATAEAGPGAEETTDVRTDSGGPSDADGDRDRSSFATDALDEETTVDAVTDPDAGEGDDADDAT